MYQYQAAYYLLQGSQMYLAKPSMHERLSIEKADAAVFSCLLMIWFIQMSVWPGSVRRRLIADNCVGVFKLID